MYVSRFKQSKFIYFEVVLNKQCIWRTCTTNCHPMYTHVFVVFLLGDGDGDRDGINLDPPSSLSLVPTPGGENEKKILERHFFCFFLVIGERWPSLAGYEPSRMRPSNTPTPKIFAVISKYMTALHACLLRCSLKCLVVVFDMFEVR